MSTMPAMRTDFQSEYVLRSVKVASFAPNDSNYVVKTLVFPHLAEGEGKKKVVLGEFVAASLSHAEENSGNLCSSGSTTGRVAVYYKRLGSGDLQDVVRKAPFPSGRGGCSLAVSQSLNMVSLRVPGPPVADDPSLRPYYPAVSNMAKISGGPVLGSFLSTDDWSTATLFTVLEDGSTGSFLLEERVVVSPELQPQAKLLFPYRGSFPVPSNSSRNSNNSNRNRNKAGGGGGFGKAELAPPTFGGVSSVSFGGTIAAISLHDNSTSPPSPVIGFFSLSEASAKFLGSYQTPHSDLITSLKFHPRCASILVAGSEDGLVSGKSRFALVFYGERHPCGTPKLLLH